MEAWKTRLDFCSIIQVRKLQKFILKFLQTVLFITLAKLAHAESLGWVIKHFSCWKSSIQKNRVKFVACVAQKISAPCGTPWPTFVCGEGSLLTTNWNLSDTYESHQLSTCPSILIMLFSHCYKNLVISGSSTLHWWNETLQVTKISVLWEFQHWWLIVFFSEANPKMSSIQNLPLPIFFF